MKINNMFFYRYRWWLLVFFLLCIALGYYRWQRNSHSDVLWQIVSQQCLPNQQATGKPAPCAQVDDQAGFVVLKDRNGPLQYLLLPSAKITGIESSLLLTDKTANFFALAWQARHFMADKYGQPIDDSNIALTINSASGRTQNQLHIHISCLRPELKAQFINIDQRLTNAWQPLPEKLLGHDYLARRVSQEELTTSGAFLLLANGVPHAKEQMGQYGLALLKMSQQHFLLLALPRNLLQFNLASAEELQDHRCQLLDPVP